MKGKFYKTMYIICELVSLVAIIGGVIWLFSLLPHPPPSFDMRCHEDPKTKELICERYYGN